MTRAHGNEAPRQVEQRQVCYPFYSRSVASRCFGEIGYVVVSVCGGVLILQVQSIRKLHCRNQSSAQLLKRSQIRGSRD